MITPSVWPSLIASPVQTENSHSIDFKLLKSLIDDKHVHLDDLFNLTHTVRARSVYRYADVGSDVKIETTLWVAWLARQQDREQAGSQFLKLLDSKIHTPNWLAPVAVDLKNQMSISGLDVAALHFSDEDFRKVLASLSSDELTKARQLVPSARWPCVSAHLCRGDKLDAILDLGWDIDQPNNRGKTAVFVARTWSGAKELLDKGANVLQTSPEGKTLWDVFPMWAKSSEEMREVGSYLDQKLAKAKPSSSTEQDLRISRVFTNINSSLVSGFPSTLKSLSKLPNPSGAAATNHMGQTFGQALVRVMNSKYHKNHKVETKRSYFRFANHLLAADPHPWIKLGDVPDPKFPSMTDLDHLLMGTLMFSTRKSSFERADLGDHLKQACQGWTYASFEKCMDGAAEWIKEYTPEEPIKSLSAFLGAYHNGEHTTMFDVFQKYVNTYWSNLAPDNGMVLEICSQGYQSLPWMDNCVSDEGRMVSGSHKYPHWIDNAILNQQNKAEELSSPQLAKWDKLLIDSWLTNMLLVAVGEESGKIYFEKIQAAYDIVSDPQFQDRNRDYLKQIMTWWFDVPHQGRKVSYYLDDDMEASIHQHSRVLHQDSGDHSQVHELLNTMEALYLQFELEHAKGASQSSPKRKI